MQRTALAPPLNRGLTDPMFVLPYGVVAQIDCENNRFEYNHGFTKAELAKVAVLVREHESAIQRAWHEYFGSN